MDQALLVCAGFHVAAFQWSKSQLEALTHWVWVLKPDTFQDIMTFLLLSKLRTTCTAIKHLDLYAFKQSSAQQHVSRLLKVDNHGEV